MGRKSQRSRKIPYLGKIKLKWCNNCKLPILESKQCPKCGNTTKKVKVTPPGDIRPAFKEEMDNIREIIDKEYGTNLGHFLLPKGRIYIINKMPGLDLTEEIIADGKIYGIIGYNPFQEKYYFKPKRIAAKLLYYYSKEENIELKKKIEINEEALPFILDGKSILAPGVISYDLDIKIRDHCIIVYKNKYVTTAIASIDGTQISEIIAENYGQIARNIKRNINNSYKDDNAVKSVLRARKESSHLDWKAVYKINENYLLKIVEEAQNFIGKQISLYKKKKICVAFSGGKDSLTVLLLVYSVVGPNFSIIFADTGLELPEIMNNTRKIARILGMEDKLRIEPAGDTFWKLIEEFGPPSRDFRFCCHTLKAQNVSHIIEKLDNGNKVLSFLGQRRYESFSRSEEKMVYVNSFIPLQIAAIPIKNWCALEVWLYLLYYPHVIDQNEVDIPITSLYFKGFERLGCYLCPASSLATLNLVREIHPDLMDKWDKWLKKYAVEYNKSKEWIKYGFWRFKQISPLWAKELKKRNIDYVSINGEDTHSLNIKITKGFSSCGYGKYSIEGIVNIPVDLNKIRSIIPVIADKSRLIDNLEIITANVAENLININNDGTFFFEFKNKDSNYARLFDDIMTIIAKSHFCTKCGVCVTACTRGLIKIIEDSEQNSYPIISPERSRECIHCRNCITHCPLYQKLKNQF
ncbi:MAG: phosphoadenosine phosphosulfate reductase family protein [Candidatus Lokiarchaeota archaeon]|nr:phosphoadenosine phosphosulfate reductase family protein [Candidatus Lokiarchaeota archaeon]